MPAVFNSLWVGPRLKYLERLCLQSAVACGHHFVLWSYEPDRLKDVPAGVELRDAAEVMPRDRMASYSGNGYVSLGANLWRYEMLAQDLGFWVDMDLIFLKPFDFAQPYVFGWQSHGLVNNAVIGAPADSPLVADLRALPRPNRRPPWFGVGKSTAFYWKRLTQGEVGLGDFPWATFGPGLLTYAVKKNKLGGFVQGEDVFYPLGWSDATDLYGPADLVERRVTARTHAVHMWHARLAGLRDAPPPPGSYLDIMCERLGVNTDAQP